MLKCLMQLGQGVSQTVKRIFSRYKELFLIAAVTTVVFLLMLIFQIPCPVKHLTGLSCAGCGMTRACLAALSLDFVSAFELHPLWVMLLPIGVLLLVLNIKGKRQASNVVLICTAVLFFAVWAVRLAAGDGIVAFDFENSIIQKITELF